MILVKGHSDFKVKTCFLFHIEMEGKGGWIIGGGGAKGMLPPPPLKLLGGSLPPSSSYTFADIKEFGRLVLRSLEG